VLLLAVVALPACGAKQEKEAALKPPEAGFVVVRAQTVPLVIELPGRTAAYEQSEVRPQVAGLIKARNFEQGSIVHKGQTLYQIDPNLYQASVNQAAADVANARATREAAQILADRYKPLAKIQAVAQQDYTNAVASAREADATLQQRLATLATARINLGYTRVPAPITGRVGRSLFTVGALVTASQTDPLTTIQRLDPIYVDIQQSSAAILALRRSLEKQGVVPSSAAVRLKLEDGSDYGPVGRVDFTEPTVDTTTGTVTLRATFPNPQGLLLPGMYVRAVLSQATTRNGILVPQQGLSRSAKGDATVMLIGPDNKAVERTVTAPQTVGQAWLVTAGLKPGDRVIVEGLSHIKPKQPVRPVPAGSKPAPAPDKKAGDETQGSSR
jgi:membrane fusion protein (multidrug efflux system)